MGEPMWRKRALSLLLVGMVGLVLGCPWGGHPMPDELVGKWETSEKKFKGFSFELTADSIIFTDLNSPKGPEMNHIEKIQMEKQGAEILYTLRNRTEEGLKHKFVFYYNPKSREIRLKNQDQFVWKKVK